MPSFGTAMGLNPMDSKNIQSGNGPEDVHHTGICLGLEGSRRVNIGLQGSTGVYRALQGSKGVYRCRLNWSGQLCFNQSEQ